MYTHTDIHSLLLSLSLSLSLSLNRQAHTFIGFSLDDHSIDETVLHPIVIHIQYTKHVLNVTYFVYYQSQILENEEATLG